MRVEGWGLGGCKAKITRSQNTSSWTEGPGICGNRDFEQIVLVTLTYHQRAERDDAQYDAHAIDTESRNMDDRP